MSTLQSEVFEALRAVDIPEDKALQAATALSRRDADVADLKADMRLLKWITTTTGGLVLLLLGIAINSMMRLGELSGQITQLAQRIH